MGRLESEYDKGAWYRIPKQSIKKYYFGKNKFVLRHRRDFRLLNNVGTLKDCRTFEVGLNEFCIMRET